MHLRPSVTVYAAPAPCRHARTCSTAVRFSECGRGARLWSGRVIDASVRSRLGFRRARNARLPSVPPSSPSAVMAGLVPAIHVLRHRGASREGRGGGPTWMAGTSPAMTRQRRGRREDRRGSNENGHAIEHFSTGHGRSRPHPNPLPMGERGFRRRPLPVFSPPACGRGRGRAARPSRLKPDSNGTSPGMTEEMSRASRPSSYLYKPPSKGPPRPWGPFKVNRATFQP